MSDLGLFFHQTPTISSTSSAFTLSSEIISADTLNIFIFAIVGGICIGFIFALLKRITSWVWK